MRVLWTSNIIFPEVADNLNLKSYYGEGWLIALSTLLIKQKNIELSIISFSNQVNKISKYQGDSITYYILPVSLLKNGNRIIKEALLPIIIELNPDIIHVNGTEYPYVLNIVKLFPKNKFVLSIQGLVSVNQRYYFTGFEFSEIIQNPIMAILIYRSKIKTINNSYYEIEYIKSIYNIIGRTFWDNIHCKYANSQVNYHICNELLRESFYNEIWLIDEIERQSIFISQATYPIKGFHIALKALKLVKCSFPNFKVYVSGNIPSIEGTSKLRSFLNKYSYGNFIFNRIKEYGLLENIIFTGPLSEREMVKYYKRANVFLSPSTIENSPNSVGEAQLIGTPVVSSYVGGVPDLIKDKVTGLLYNVNEYEVLAEKIISIFKNDDLAIKLSKNERIAALKRHNHKKIINNLISIYNNVINE